MKRAFFYLKTIFRVILKKEIDYKSYWNDRYAAGGNSGKGSYDLLAQFKTQVINDFISKNNINCVIEFGCGDGNQIKSINYEKYLGLDVSEYSIRKCNDIFHNDMSKSFMKYEPNAFFNNNFIKSHLVICLDVLYHIIPENEYLKTLSDIFSCSSQYVVLYTSIEAHKKEGYKIGAHVRHRDTKHYLSRFKDFKIVEIIPQKYPKLSSADFIILKRI